MRRKASKILALLTVLAVTVLAKPQYALAANEGETAINDIKTDSAAGRPAVSEESLKAEELTVEITGNETALDTADRVRTAALTNESIIRYGRVSGYLEQTGKYALYSIELSAGDYLQAKLTQPNDVTINYDLVLYDSSLSVIKVSDYITYINGTAPLEESIGYLASSDELVYVGIFSLLGGSTTEPYTLNFSITTDFSDASEPNENAKEADALTLGSSGASVSATLNTAIDNDWYSFTVADSVAYDKIRFILTSDSTVNSAAFEVYQNTMTNAYAMQRVCYGKEGEIKLPAGSYFLRVMSTHTSGTFDVNDTFGYTLSVTPVTKVEGIEITQYSGYNGVDKVDYAEGRFYRIDDNDPNKIRITGFAYYTDSIGNKYTAKNVSVVASVNNRQLEEAGETEKAKTYGSAVTGNNGYFTLTVYMYPAMGGLTYNGSVSTHYYDLMDVEVWNKYDDTISTEGNFYILERSVLH